MAQAMKIVERVTITARTPMSVAAPRPMLGSHSQQIRNAFIVAFNQYEKAFEELAKV